MLCPFSSSPQSSATSFCHILLPQTALTVLLPILIISGFSLLLYADSAQESLDVFSEFHTSISNDLLNTATWMIDKHLQLSLSETKLIIFSLKNYTFFVSQWIAPSSTQASKPENWFENFPLFSLPFALFRFSLSLAWVTITVMLPEVLKIQLNIATEMHHKNTMV